MAYIIDSGVETTDLEKIAAFMRSDGEDLPEQLTELGEQLLDELTSKPVGTWILKVGRFEPHVVEEELYDMRSGDPVHIYRNAVGELTEHADVLLADQEGVKTRVPGMVVVDYEKPQGIFHIGVPL